MTSAPGATPANLALAANSPCGVPPVVCPTTAVDPGHVQKDSSTGLHITSELQLIEFPTYRLLVTRCTKTNRC